MLDAFAARNFPQNLGDFIGTIARRQDRDVLSDRLFRRVAVNALGSLVPTGDSAVQVFADDRVLGGIDNRGQARPVFASCSAVLRCSSSFARRSSSAMRLRSLMSRMALKTTILFRWRPG
jgi:hypothetical protein